MRVHVSDCHLPVLGRYDIVVSPSDDMKTFLYSVAQKLGYSFSALWRSGHIFSEQEYMEVISAGRILNASGASITDLAELSNGDAVSVAFDFDRTGPGHLVPHPMTTTWERTRQYNRNVLEAHARAVTSDNDAISRTPPRLRPPPRPRSPPFIASDTLPEVVLTDMDALNFVDGLLDPTDPMPACPMPAPVLGPVPPVPAVPVPAPVPAPVPVTVPVVVPVLRPGYPLPSLQVRLQALSESCTAAQQDEAAAYAARLGVQVFFVPPSVLKQEPDLSEMELKMDYALSEMQAARKDLQAGHMILQDMQRLLERLPQ